MKLVLLALALLLAGCTAPASPATHGTRPLVLAAIGHCSDGAMVEGVLAQGAELTMRCGLARGSVPR